MSKCKYIVPEDQVQLPKYTVPEDQVQLPKYTVPEDQVQLPKYTVPEDQAQLPKYTVPEDQAQLPKYEYMKFLNREIALKKKNNDKKQFCIVGKSKVLQSRHWLDYY